MIEVFDAFDRHRPMGWGGTPCASCQRRPTMVFVKITGDVNLEPGALGLCFWCAAGLVDKMARKILKEREVVEKHPMPVVAGALRYLKAQGWSMREIVNATQQRKVGAVELAEEIRSQST